MPAPCHPHVQGALPNVGTRRSPNNCNPNEFRDLRAPCAAYSPRGGAEGIVPPLLWAAPHVLCRPQLVCRRPVKVSPSLGDETLPREGPQPPQFSHVFLTVREGNGSDRGEGPASHPVPDTGVSLFLLGYLLKRKRQGWTPGESTVAGTPWERDVMLRAGQLPGWRRWGNRARWACAPLGEATAGVASLTQPGSLTQPSGRQGQLLPQALRDLCPGLWRCGGAGGGSHSGWTRPGPAGMAGALGLVAPPEARTLVLPC